jgi:hypothetical protein
VHPRALVGTVLEARRRHGVAAAAGTLLEGLAQVFVRLEFVQIIMLERSRAPAQPAETGGRFGAVLADEATLLALQAQEDWGIDAVKLAALRAGDQCLLNLVDGRPAGYTWVHSRGLPEILPGLWLRLPPGWLYNFAAYTHPAFRGSGLQSWRHAAVLRHPAWQGSAGLVGWVRATNHASRRGQGKSGYVPVGWIVRVGLGPWQMTLSSTSLTRRGMACLPAPMRPAAAAPAR